MLNVETKVNLLPDAILVFHFLFEFPCDLLRISSHVLQALEERFDGPSNISGHQYSCPDAHNAADFSPRRPDMRGLFHQPPDRIVIPQASVDICRGRPSNLYRREERGRSGGGTTGLPDGTVIDNIPETFVASKTKGFPEFFTGDTYESGKCYHEHGPRATSHEATGGSSSHIALVAFAGVGGSESEKRVFTCSSLVS